MKCIPLTGNKIGNKSSTTPDTKTGAQTENVDKTKSIEGEASRFASASFSSLGSGSASGAASSSARGGDHRLILRDLSKHIQQLDELVSKLTFSLREINRCWGYIEAPTFSTRLRKAAPLILLSRLVRPGLRLRTGPEVTS